MADPRIFCIGKNYGEHVAELAHLGHDADLVVFMKPASCIVPVDEPIPLPRGRGAVHHEAELVVRLGGDWLDALAPGQAIPVERAMACVSALTLGIDLTLREVQTALKNRGAPWELAKAFDGAAPLGEFVPYRGQDLQALEFTCHVNGALRQHGRTREMRYPVARQIHVLSQTWRLRSGDLLYTGTPKGVGPLVAGDRIELAAQGIGRFVWDCV
ncbi:MAG: fumarylacetoacetate hydrolase family protein [Sinobacteraceae bacterium]|nr:fumarylacetoacetate hydrolase family protein [Nevskiaceae bacterium]